MVGKRFGRLTVVGPCIVNMYGKRLYKCLCDCGKFTFTQRDHLLSGNTSSCGCLKVKHGDRNRLNPTKEYVAWKGMKKRCYNSNCESYRNYGGRGIVVSDMWLHDYKQFLQDVGRAPGPEYSIERINNDGNYEPGNVCWATAEDQANNRRSSKWH